MLRSRRATKRDLFVALAVTAVMLAAAMGYVVLGERYTRTHPPAAAPADLCSVIGASLIESLVPGGAPVPEATPSSGAGASCHYLTRNSPPGTDSYGLLHVRLLRHGGVFWRQGTTRASDALGAACDVSGFAGKLYDTEGYGDEACTADHDGGSDGTSESSVILRRGADLIWVDYALHPAGAGQTRQGVVEVVGATLGAIR